MLLLTGAVLGRTAVPPGCPWAVLVRGQGCVSAGHAQLPAEPPQGLLLCCAQAVEIWMCVEVFVLEEECFLFLKYKWPIGKEIFTNTEIEPEHCVLVGMFTGCDVILLTTQRCCLWVCVCDFSLPCHTVQFF